MVLETTKAENAINNHLKNNPYELYIKRSDICYDEIYNQKKNEKKYRCSRGPFLHNVKVVVAFFLFLLIVDLVEINTYLPV